jgi:hypothetical protein
MNRIVLIGNGFDLAHGLPTRYEDFINWYWNYRVAGFYNNHSSVSRDILCEFEIESPYLWDDYYKVLSKNHVSKGKEIIDSIIHDEFRAKTRYSFSPFFGNIIKSIETKGWADIENEYYNQLKKCTIEGSLNQDAVKELNSQLSYITDLLVDYLKWISNKYKESIRNKKIISISKKFPIKIESISDIIYSPINPGDVSVEGQNIVKEFVKDRIKNDSYISDKIKQYNLNEQDCQNQIKRTKEYLEKRGIMPIHLPQFLTIPDEVLILNFNYTYTAEFPYKLSDIGYKIHIHGDLTDRDSIIFGYGDELDEKYQQLQALNENECLKNIKSIRYLESANYRYVLQFLESEPFQVLIMGHSCGNSDRTLLNTIFEHKNCISIKPYYHIKKNGKDNYLDIVQNISRNFTNMKLMRDRVVNKKFCLPLPQAEPKGTS